MRYRTDFAQMAKGYGADGVFIRSADELGPALDRGARLRPADGHPGADGERADADAGALGHQLRLPERQLAAGGHDRRRRRRSAHARALVSDPGARRRRHDDQLPRSDGAGHRGAVLTKDLGSPRRQMGLVFSAFSWSYALLQIPGGIFLDRFGTRLTYFIAVVFWSVCTALMGVVQLAERAAPDPDRRRRLRGAVLPGQQPDPRDLVSAARAGPRELRSIRSDSTSASAS